MAATEGTPWGAPLEPRRPRRSHTLAVARDDDRRILDLAVKRGLVDNVSARECLFLHEEAQKRGERPSMAKLLVDKGLITRFQADELVGSGAPAPAAAAAAQAPAAVKRGDVVGGYRIMDKIGEGAMGAVYRAVQVALDRTVALKLLPERLARNPQFIERFLREAKAAARLEHPNVVRAIDAGESGGRYYFAMELVEGRSFEAVLRERGALGEDEVVDVGVQAARGLVCAWRGGMVHRDIKPENLLVTHEGVVKIADLGLVRSIGTGENRLTQEGIALGTPHYISPEQAQAADVDIRTDIFALGITLFRAASATLPFDDKDPVKVVAMRLKEDVPPLRRVAPKASKELEQVVSLMTARARDDRYPDPVVLLWDLERMASGDKPEYAAGGRAARARVLETAHQAADTRSHHTIATRARPRRTHLFVLAAVAAALAAAWLAVASRGHGGAGAPVEADRVRAALVESALLSALRGDFEGASRLVAAAGPHAPQDDAEALAKLVKRAEFIHAARQTELAGKREEAFAVYQKALALDDDPAVRAYLARLKERAGILP